MMDIDFKYNRDKARNAVLWVIHNNGGPVDKMRLVRLAFLADRASLSRHGRPIFGGKYMAMSHGPVSSELLDDLNGRVQEPHPLFVYQKQNHSVEALSKLNDEHLSVSDLKVLSEIMKEYGLMDAWMLGDLIRTLNAWKSNFQGTSSVLPYEDFFLDLPEEEQDMLKIIEEDQLPL